MRWIGGFARHERGPVKRVAESNGKRESAGSDPSVSDSPFSDAGALRALLRHPGARAGLVLLSLVLLPALAAPWLPLADPTLTEPARRMLPPLSTGHLLGTDQLGRDLLSRLIWGARSSIAVGLSATALAALIGILVGLLAGWLGRAADALLMRGIDVLMAFPYLLLALAIVAALGPGLANAMLAIAVANVPFFARAVRGAVLDIRHRDYIAAARLCGHGELAIVRHEVLPNLAPTVLLLMTTTLGWMILETAGLSFLGLGAQPPQADLGSMLGEGRELLTTYPRVAVLPGVVILVMVVGINLLGDALRDAIDPGHRSIGPAPRASRRTDDVEPRQDDGGSTGVESVADTDTDSRRQLLRVRALGVAFPTASGYADAVEGVSFDLGRGERVALVGESGSGKTLTALALLRLLPEQADLQGRVGFDGRSLTALDARGMRALRGRRIAYVPQEPLTALDPLFRVGAQLDEAILAHAPSADPRPRGDKLIEAVGLAGVPVLRRRFPHELSGGQRQRVAIAMALAHDPDLLIADEATTALDVTVQQEILTLLQRLCEDGGRSLLFVTHDLALAARLCRRVLVMYAGRIVEDAPLQRLLIRPAHPYTHALIACSPELGRPDKPLAAVAGQPPAPGALRQGCRFAPRCPRVQPICREREPALAAVGAAGAVDAGTDHVSPRPVCVPARHRVRCLFPMEDA